jgi:hypothetical protein
MNANASHSSNIDHTIDRALSALRDAQPRSGLEGRILASLEHRTIAPQSTRLHLSAHVVLWTATAAAILAVASLIILHHHTTPTEFAHNSARPTNSVILSDQSNAVILSERSESKNPDNARHATNSEPFATTNLARTTHTASSRPERVARSGETPVFENCSDHHSTGCPTHDDNAVTDRATGTPTDAQALADLHAPSHPAPPLPLTPQEKLFLHMLHYGNLTQLAELNPIVRAQHDDDEATAFKTFFPDPPPLKQPLGDTE